MCFIGFAAVQEPAFDAWNFPVYDPLAWEKKCIEYYGSQDQFVQAVAFAAGDTQLLAVEKEDYSILTLNARSCFTILAFCASDIHMYPSVNYILSHWEQIKRYSSEKKRDAYVNGRSSLLGATALMYAASSGNMPMVCLLLSYNADLLLKDQRQRTAVDYAQSFRRTEVARFLTYMIRLKKQCSAVRLSASAVHLGVFLPKSFTVICAGLRNVRSHSDLVRYLEDDCRVAFS